MPARLTIRASEELVDRIRASAQRAGRSMNEYVVMVRDAATDPDTIDDHAERLRDRFRRAGILLEVTTTDRAEPDPERLAAARAQAGRGTPLSDFVSSVR